MKLFLSGFLFSFFLVSFVAVGMYWGISSVSKNQNNETQLSENLILPTQSQKTVLQTATQSSDIAKSDDVGISREKILTYLNAKNYDELSKHAASTLPVSVMGSSCCGVLNNETFKKQLHYLAPATNTWRDANDSELKVLFEKLSLNESSFIFVNDEHYALVVDVDKSGELIINAVFSSDFTL